MKIQYTCCCGSKFIGITEVTNIMSQAWDNEFNAIVEQYEKFKSRHASCHKKLKGEQSNET